MEDVAPSTQLAQILLDPAAVSPLIVSELRMWLVNTNDYYIQNPFLLPKDKDGPGCIRVRVPLTDDAVRRHLIGHHTIGLYAVNPVRNTCKWIALDGDYDGALEHLEQIAAKMREDGLSPAFEDSRRGAHLWVLFEEPVPARLCRIYIYSLLDQGGYAISGRGGRTNGIEVNPKHESLEEGHVGNGLRAPGGVHRKSFKRYTFRDAAPDIESQFRYLRLLPRCTLDHLEELTAGMDMPEDMRPQPRTAYRPSAPHPGGFDIRLYVDLPRRRSRRDYFVQCPSCAEAGKDNGRDNLHITEDNGTVEAGNAPLFHCFANCRGSDIIAACHRRAGYNSGDPPEE